MVVYWDLVALWNFALDYLLLLGTLRLAGRPVRRLRVALAAALGAAYSVAALALPFSLWTLAGALLLMCCAAFGHTGRFLKLTLLFLLLACGLGGGVLLLGRVSGGMERLARGMVYAQLPWGVFFAAAGLSYLLLTLIFRGGARHGAGDFVTARVTYGGRSVTLRLLRDTGNALTDPLTGEGVPVIEESALAPLFEEGNGGSAAYTTFTPLRVGTVSGGGTLRAFRCDELSVDGRSPYRRSRWAARIRGCGFPGKWRRNGMIWRQWWANLREWLARQGLLLRDTVHYIGGSDTLPPPFPRDKEAELIARLDAGESGVRQALIEHNLRLVVYIARRFENTGVGIEDLISIGTIGLIKGVNTYRSDKNIKLATYASRCIENEILMHLRKTANQKSEVSFDEPLNTDWDGNELLLSDILGTEEDVVMKPIEEDVDRTLLRDAIATLSAREREIITLRFGLDGRDELTQKEVADKMGISQSYISRLEKRIIVRLKKEILRMS